ncbi:MAG TPA: hypothetical protein VN279_04100 [Rhodocyclaceae bacterium]|nr:hypothetical protein [Rhodocyclaceae bacterium]
MKPTNPIRHGLAALAAASALASPSAVLAEEAGRTLFVASAVEHPDDTVTLPLHQGRGPDGRAVYYVIIDTSDGKDAAALGVNHAPKLNNARGTEAVVKVTAAPGGQVQFPGTVQFGLAVPVATPPFLPPATPSYKARGEPDYSPLIQLPNGVIRNAPHVANATGTHPKVVAIDYATGKVRLRMTNGFAGGKAVKYVSTDASVDLAAALEDVTLAPRLNAAPFAGGDGTDSARTSLALFVNGRTGADNPQRQGVNSAIIDGLDPLNVLAWTPNQGRYSPLWDVFPGEWSAKAVANGANLRQTDFGKVRNLANDGLVTGPGGAPFGAAGFIVNCPIISQE